MAKWILKKNKIQQYAAKTHCSFNELHGLKAKGWKKLFHENCNHRGAGMAILISGKIDFHSKRVKKDKNHYTVINESIYA